MYYIISEDDHVFLEADDILIFDSDDLTIESIDVEDLKKLMMKNGNYVGSRIVWDRLKNGDYDLEFDELYVGNTLQDIINDDVVYALGDKLRINKTSITFNGIRKHYHDEVRDLLQILGIRNVKFLGVSFLEYSDDNKYIILSDTLTHHNNSNHWWDIEFYYDSKLELCKLAVNKSIIFEKSLLSNIKKIMARQKLLDGNIDILSLADIYRQAGGK